MNPKHSFVVLAYKESHYLERCLASLACQSEQSKVIISTSTPNQFLTDAAKKFDVPLVVHPERTGMGSDWTFGYKIADTEYVTLAHQDDEYAPGYSSNLMAAATRHQDALILFPDYAEIIKDEWRYSGLNLSIKRMLLRFGFWRSEAIRSQFWKKVAFSGGNPICCPAVTYHKGLIGELQFSNTSRFVLDWETWIQLAIRQGAFVYLRECLMGHRIHAESETTKVTIGVERLNEERAMFERLWPKPVAQVLSTIYRLSHLSNARY